MKERGRRELSGESGEASEGKRKSKGRKGVNRESGSSRKV